ncbi:hypothetical protein ACVCL3_16010 [Rhodanobacter sp. UC4437_H4]
MCELLIQLINRTVAIPPPAARRRRWVRVGQCMRFPSGLQVDVQCATAINGHPDLHLRWHFGTATMAAVTCYEPVSLVSDCGLRVVIRAVAQRAGVPVAVLMELEAVKAAPVASIGWSA